MRATETAGSAAAGNTAVLRRGLEPLTALAEELDDLRGILRTLNGAGDAAAKTAIRRLEAELDAFEPSITMIGQVKAGKTSLVNCMVGWPGLLPADVNPWTSVVTSLHLNPPGLGDQTSASFRFFDEDEWGRLVESGGRLGELASRAGADDEVEKVRRQVEEMRDKSRKRLGKRFELLLGQEHSYGYFDKTLIERYVCLGDDFGDDTDTSDERGQFADITRSADLKLNRDEIPLPLCVRDTPGVNDTFMMREQITIRAIRESRICVVVLSAHQALSAVDMGLVRLISNVKSRDIVIFVNRIDELQDPASQIPEIEESIKATLAAHQGPADCEIVFGSAYWAEKVLTGGLKKLNPDSAAALMNLARARMVRSEQKLSPTETVWELSGVPTLYRALSDRIVTGVGREKIDRIAASATNIARGLDASSKMVELRSSDSTIQPIDRKALDAALREIEETAREALDAGMIKLTGAFHTRVDRAHRSFLDRAVASLLSHLESYGDGEIWQYDPTGLRLLLRSAHQVYTAQADGAFKKASRDACAAYAELYQRVAGAAVDGIEIAPPTPPRAEPPVHLGQTIALDLKGNWWSRWWQRRRGYQSYANDFAEMIAAETAPIVDDLKTHHPETVQVAAQTALRTFLVEQSTILRGLSDQSDVGVEDLDAIFGIRERAARQDAIAGTLDALARWAA